MQRGTAVDWLVKEELGFHYDKPDISDSAWTFAHELVEVYYKSLEFKRLRDSVLCATRSMAEDLLVGEWGGVPIRGRPDLVYWAGDECTILDWKVTKTKPPRPRGAYLDYLQWAEQLLFYKNLLNERAPSYKVHAISYHTGVKIIEYSGKITKKLEKLTCYKLKNMANLCEIGHVFDNLPISESEELVERLKTRITGITGNTDIDVWFRKFRNYRIISKTN